MQVATVDELLEIQTKLENLVLELGNMDEDIAVLTTSIAQKTIELDQFSDTIHNNRLQAIPVLSNKLISILETLGMPNVRFKIDVKASETYYPNGKDELIAVTGIVDPG